MKTKVDIFSGFLGAGKTTLIKKLISEGLYRENMVIIENEFGEVGIDGKILKGANIEVKEVNAGCICCSISGDFKKALRDVVEKYNPQRIIIEPSGIAKLSEIITACSTMELRSLLELNMIITIVDVMRFDAYSLNFGEFYKNQVMNCKTVVLSRTQNVTTDKLLSVKESIQKLNSSAVIVTTPWEMLSGDKIIRACEHNHKPHLEEVNLLRRPTGEVTVRSTNNHSGNEVFQSIGWETPKKFNSRALRERLDKTNNSKIYGTILRAKGIVQADNDEWLQFDYVPGEFEMRKTPPDYSGRFCIIGVNLNKEKLKRLFDV